MRQSVFVVNRHVGFVGMCSLESVPSSLCMKPTTHRSSTWSPSRTPRSPVAWQWGHQQTSPFNHLVPYWSAWLLVSSVCTVMLSSNLSWPNWALTTHAVGRISRWLALIDALMSHAGSNIWIGSCVFTCLCCVSDYSCQCSNFPQRSPDHSFHRCPQPTWHAWGFRCHCVCVCGRGGEWPSLRWVRESSRSSAFAAIIRPHAVLNERNDLFWQAKTLEGCSQLDKAPMAGALVIINCTHSVFWDAMPTLACQNRTMQVIKPGFKYLRSWWLLRSASPEGSSRA